MKELPSDFEEKYLELIEPYQSDETEKTRRNLSVASFIICGLYFIGIPLDHIRVFITDLRGADLRAIYIVAFALLGYWLMLFTLLMLKDRGIHKERVRLSMALADNIRFYRDRLDHELKNLEKGRHGVPHPKEDRLAQVNGVCERIDAYTNKTSLIRKLTNSTRRIIDWTPFPLSIVAIGLLVWDLTTAPRWNDNISIYKYGIVYHHDRSSQQKRGPATGQARPGVGQAVQKTPDRR